MSVNIITGPEWDNAIQHLPGAHVLQSWAWSQFKARYGWQPLPQLWRDESSQVRAAAMVLRRTAAGGLASILYVPRGPLVDWSDPVWSTRVIDELQSLARKTGALVLTADPELVLGYGVPGREDEQPNPDGERVQADLLARGWCFSPDQVQFRNTVVLDLTGDEETWLGRMKQKGRYNIRLAERKGVQVRAGSLNDLPILYRLYAETSVRDGFVIRSKEYYLTLWQDFMQRGMAEPLIAEVEGEIVAGVFLFYFAKRAWYLYGMSSETHREKMPNYLLQWEAMRRAKAHGCLSYDLWGAPDVFDESDSMWGVFGFKEKLGGRVVRTAGAWDYPAQPLLYRLYTGVMPRVMDLLRQRGKKQTVQGLS